MFDSAGGDMAVKEGEDSLGDADGVDDLRARGLIEIIANLREEFVAVALLCGEAGGDEAFVIEAAGDHGELGAEIGALVDGDKVADGVEGDFQGFIGLLTSIKMEFFLEFVEPDIEGLKGGVQIADSCIGHGCCLDC